MSSGFLDFSAIPLLQRALDSGASLLATGSVSTADKSGWEANAEQAVVSVFGPTSPHLERLRKKRSVIGAMPDAQEVVHRRTQEMRERVEIIRNVLISAQDLKSITKPAESSDKVKVIPSIRGSGFDASSLLKLARTQVFFAAQNHHFLINENNEPKFRKEFFAFLRDDDSRRISILLDGPRGECAASADTWSTVTVEEHLGDLDLAHRVFSDWKRVAVEEDKVHGTIGAASLTERLRIKWTIHVPVSINFVDPEETNGLLVMTPNVFEKDSTIRPCYVIYKTEHPDLFEAYWRPYRYRFLSSKKCHDVEPSKSEDRLFVDDIGSFKRVCSVEPAQVARFLTDGYLDWKEDDVQKALEEILDVADHKKDWSGEKNDLYTSHVTVNGARTATAFLLKGNGLRASQMEIKHCGKNGDQVVRLFESPANLFVIQYVGNISENLIKHVQSEVAQLKGQNKPAKFLIMDGQDTARLLHAYGKLRCD